MLKTTIAWILNPALDSSTEILVMKHLGGFFALTKVLCFELDLLYLILFFFFLDLKRSFSLERCNFKQVKVFTEKKVFLIRWEWDGSNLSFIGVFICWRTQSRIIYIFFFLFRVILWLISCQGRLGHFYYPMEIRGKTFLRKKNWKLIRSIKVEKVM